MSMNLDDATILVTGTNRGIGLAFAKAALVRGAGKVYAGARDPKRVTLSGVTPIRLDVEVPDDVAAAWSRTNGLRHALRGQKTQVLTLHMAFVDTDMARGVAVPKSAPEGVVARAFDGLEAGAEAVLADEKTQQVKFGLSAHPGMYLQARE